MKQRNKDRKRKEKKKKQQQQQQQQQLHPKTNKQTTRLLSIRKYFTWRQLV